MSYRLCRYRLRQLWQQPFGHVLVSSFLSSLLFGIFLLRLNLVLSVSHIFVQQSVKFCLGADYFKADHLIGDTHLEGTSLRKTMSSSSQIPWSLVVLRLQVRSHEISLTHVH